MALREPGTSIPDGSVLACKGKGFTSMIIRWWTGLINFRPCPSHVAIVFRTPEGKRFVWESTTLSGVPDAIDGEKRDGVQAHYLDRFLDAYNGRVSVYPLDPPLTTPETEAALKYLQDRHNAKTPYDKEGAIDSASPDHAQRDDSKLFCSELVTRALQLAGRVSQSVNYSEQTPCDVVGWPIFGAKRRLT